MNNELKEIATQIIMALNAYGVGLPIDTAKDEMIQEVVEILKQIPHTNKNVIVGNVQDVQNFTLGDGH